MNLPKFKVRVPLFSDFQFVAGDFVFYCSDEEPNGFSCVVESVKDLKWRLIYSDNQKKPLWAEENQVVPIPLDDRILEQFGFEKFHNVRIKDGIVIKKQGDHLYEFEGFPVCWVHELQRVYFLYTTEHLKIIK